MNGQNTYVFVFFRFCIYLTFVEILRWFIFVNHGNMITTEEVEKH